MHVILKSLSILINKHLRNVTPKYLLCNIGNIKMEERIAQREKFSFRAFEAFFGMKFWLHPATRRDPTFHPSKSYECFKIKKSIYLQPESRVQMNLPQRHRDIKLVYNQKNTTPIGTFSTIWLQHNFKMSNDIFLSYFRSNMHART